MLCLRCTTSTHGGSGKVNMNILIMYNIKALSHYLRYDNISQLIHVITCLFVKDYNSYFFYLFNLLFFLVLFHLAFLS